MRERDMTGVVRRWSCEGAVKMPVECTLDAHLFATNPI